LAASEIAGKLNEKMAKESVGVLENLASKLSSESSLSTSARSSEPRLSIVAFLRPQNELI